MKNNEKELQEMWEKVEKEMGKKSFEKLVQGTLKPLYDSKNQYVKHNSKNTTIYETREIDI